MHIGTKPFISSYRKEAAMVRHYRRHSFFALCMILALALAACGGTTASTPAATTAPGATVAPTTATQAATITIESWRSDDKAIWDSQIIPAFNKAYPNITVQFKPTAPTEYDAALNSKLQGGTAGDLITCRPFDKSLALFTAGNLAPLNDLPGMDGFS